MWEEIRVSVTSGWEKLGLPDAVNRPGCLRDRLPELGHTDFWGSDDGHKMG